MIERADVGADRVMRNSHNFIDHNLGGLFETVSRRRFNGKSEKGRINDFGRQEADCDAPKGREEKLFGEDNLYRIREGTYRVIYTIQDKKLTVLDVKIGDRNEVYR
jgi:mRNA-degrading endonuclease RelE of RelBE toxin-antitoxin system